MILIDVVDVHLMVSKMSDIDVIKMVYKMYHFVLREVLSVEAIGGDFEGAFAEAIMVTSQVDYRQSP